MLPKGLANQNMVRLRAQLSDDGYGDQQTDWSNPSRLEIRGCSLQPQTGTEILGDRTAVVTRWRWYGPPDADVTSADRLEVDGIAYDIDGSVEVWAGFGLDHKTALCRQAQG